MKTTYAALALVVAAGSAARAEGPAVMRAGVALNGTYVGGDEDPVSPAVQGGIAFLIDDDVAYGLGFHGSYAKRSETFLEGNMGPANDVAVTYEHTQTQLGIALPWLRDRYWVEPWLGAELAHNETRLAFGLGGGVDLYVHPDCHRVAVYADLTRVRVENESQYEYSVGVAYRCW